MPKKPVRPKKFAVWLFDQTLVTRLKARCARAGISVSGHVSNLIQADLDADHAPKVAKDGRKKPAERRRKLTAAVGGPATREFKPYPKVSPEEVAAALGAEPAGEQPAAPKRPGKEPFRHLPGGRVETYGPPINDSIVVCRRCDHADHLHTRGDQHACGIMGCNCSRFM